MFLAGSVMRGRSKVVSNWQQMLHGTKLQAFGMSVGLHAQGRLVTPQPSHLLLRWIRCTPGSEKACAGHAFCISFIFSPGACRQRIIRNWQTADCPKHTIRVAESKVKCPTPTQTFPKFSPPDSDLSKISDSDSLT